MLFTFKQTITLGGWKLFKYKVILFIDSRLSFDFIVDENSYTIDKSLIFLKKLKAVSEYEAAFMKLKFIYFVCYFFDGLSFFRF